jgi:hypothetical protein
MSDRDAQGRDHHRDGDRHGDRAATASLRAAAALSLGHPLQVEY